MTGSKLDRARAEAFAQKMLDVLNHAALALMTSVGHRTGLFDVMARMPASSSQQIADEAGQSERYVREWLGAMVTAGVVEHDPEARTYHLPPEHAAALTRAASPPNLAASAQWVAVLGSAEDVVVEAFRHGRGVPYSAYRRFHEVMAEESNQTVVAALTDHILPLVPGLVDRLEHGIDVLDVGCGSGRAMSFLAGRFPRSRFLGYDLSEEGIAAARAEACRRALSNLRFEVMNAAEMREGRRFDLVTAFDAIHDQARPAEVLRNIAAALRPDGTFLMQDISGSSHVHQDIGHPLGTFLYTVSCMHCMSVSLAAGGPGLGAMWGKEKALEMLGEAGFRRVHVASLPHDAVNYYYIASVSA
jgi:2-polyprenyl-3-methyl-5-hydroxy-6-metoxy-1,4-benzoquinol methylase